MRPRPTPPRKPGGGGVLTAGYHGMVRAQGAAWGQGTVGHRPRGETTTPTSTPPPPPDTDTPTTHPFYHPPTRQTCCSPLSTAACWGQAAIKSICRLHTWLAAPEEIEMVFNIGRVGSPWMRPPSRLIPDAGNPLLLVLSWDTTPAWGGGQRAAGGGDRGTVPSGRGSNTPTHPGDVWSKGINKSTRSFRIRGVPTNTVIGFGSVRYPDLPDRLPPWGDRDQS